jgi:hypothetical protein
MSQESIQKLRLWIREQGLDAFLKFSIKLLGIDK